MPTVPIKVVTANITKTKMQNKRGGRSKEVLEPTEEMLPYITELAAAGKSRKIIAVRLGISNSTLDKWMTRFPAVREAWEAGMAEHEDRLESRLELVSEDEKHKMAPVVTMFLLKVKHKYSERHQVEVQQQKFIAKSQINVVETDPSVREEFERQLAIDSEDA